MTVFVCVLSDLTWLPLLGKEGKEGGGRKSFIIIIVVVVIHCSHEAHNHIKNCHDFLNFIFDESQKIRKIALENLKLCTAYTKTRNLLLIMMNFYWLDRVLSFKFCFRTILKQLSTSAARDVLHYCSCCLVMSCIIMMPERADDSSFPSWSGRAAWTWRVACGGRTTRSGSCGSVSRQPSSSVSWSP